MGREMSSKEWAIIAASFKGKSRLSGVTVTPRSLTDTPVTEKPTPKSVQERYPKLRAEQRGKLRELGILDDDKLAKIHDVPPGDLVPGEDYTDDEDDGRDNITVKTTTPGTSNRLPLSPADHAAAQTLINISNEASDDLFYTPVDNTNKGKKKKTAPGKPPAKKVRRSAVIDDDDDDDDTTVTPLAPETEEESKARRVAEGRKAYYGS